MQEILSQVGGAIEHALKGSGPCSLRILSGPTERVAAVVFIIPGPAGEIMDDALDRLYAELGWKASRQGKGQG